MLRSLEPILPPSQPGAAPASQPPSRPSVEPSSLNLEPPSQPGAADFSPSEPETVKLARPSVPAWRRRALRLSMELPQTWILERLATWNFGIIHSLAQPSSLCPSFFPLSKFGVDEFSPSQPISRRAPSAPAWSRRAPSIISSHFPPSQPRAAELLSQPGTVEFPTFQPADPDSAWVWS